MGYSLRQITGLVGTLPRRPVPVTPAPASLEGYVAERELRLNQLCVARSALEVIADPSDPRLVSHPLRAVAKDTLAEINRLEEAAL